MNPSVVTVMVQLDDSVSVGTGVIFRADGYILTNYHVLAGGGQDCTVAMDTGRTYEAQYVAGDRRNDLAVLKVELTGLPAATFGDSDQLVVGDKVYAIGNPLGVELRSLLTDGIVSAINRDVQVDGRTMTLVQTSAALNSGNSGGPLINACGQVVGINTIKMSSDYSNVEGLGFAIPSASIRRLVNDLLTYGEVRPEPSFGVTVLQTGTRLEDDIWGLQVLEVTPGSAADLAGIREGLRPRRRRQAGGNQSGAAAHPAAAVCGRSGDHGNLAGRGADGSDADSERPGGIKERGRGLQCAAPACRKCSRPGRKRAGCLPCGAVWKKHCEAAGKALKDFSRGLCILFLPALGPQQADTGAKRYTPKGLRRTATSDWWRSRPRPGGGHGQGRRFSGWACPDSRPWRGRPGRRRRWAGRTAD